MAFVPLSHPRLSRRAAGLIGVVGGAGMAGIILGALGVALVVARPGGDAQREGGVGFKQVLKDTSNQLTYSLFGISFFSVGQDKSQLKDEVARNATARQQQGDIREIQMVMPALAPVADVQPFTNIAPTFIPPFGQRGGQGPGICAFDYDNDGRVDLFLPNPGGNALYHNEGNNVFRDVAAQAGVLDGDPKHAGAGCVAFDYDNDGWLDLYVTNRPGVKDGLDPRYGTDNARNTLYHNNHDGTFTDVTEHAGVGDTHTSFSAAAADVNGDGYLDLYVSNFASPGFLGFWKPHFNGARNTLYLNNRDGTFTDVTDQAGVGTPPMPFYDNDGVPKSAFDPTLRDRAGRQAGEDRSISHTAAFWDFNEDGKPDILVASDQGYLYLFRNDGTDAQGIPHFTDVTHLSGLDKIGSWMGLSFADWSGSGRLDFFASNMGSDVLVNQQHNEDVIAPTWGVRYTHSNHTLALFRNNGVDHIQGYGDVADLTNIAAAVEVRPSYKFPPTALDPTKVNPANRRPSGLEAYEFCFGTVAPDINNDGRPDLYFAGDLKGGFFDGIADLFPGAGRMLLNRGNWHFDDVTVETHMLLIPTANYETGEGFNIQMRDPAKGVTYADLNNDGYPDILVGTTGTKADDRYKEQDHPGPLYAFVNPGGSNHWLKLALKGRQVLDHTGSNSFGIGAVVHLWARTDGSTQTEQTQMLQAGWSDLSSGEPALLWGVGSAEQVDKIEVHWPSGRTQVVTNVPVNQRLELVEPAT